MKTLLCVVSVAGALFAATLPAQQRTAWVHGLASSGSTWDATAAIIGPEYGFVNDVPTLGNTFTSFSILGNTLHQRLFDLSGSWSIPTQNAIGHSNGGLTFRTTNMNNGRQFYGGITVGTLHLGVPLARSALDGQLQSTLEWWIDPILGAPLYYLSRWTDENFFVQSWVYGFWLDAWHTIPGWIDNVFVAGLYYGAQQTILSQMVNGSQFLGELNSSSNAAREAASFIRRFQIASVANTSLTQMWVALTDDPEAWTYAEAYAVGVYLYVFDYYFNYSNWEDPDYADKRNNAVLWAYGAQAIFDTQCVWCYLIDRHVYNDCRGDGVVPRWSQAGWPGVPLIEVPNGPGHTKETQSGSVRDAIRSALNSIPSP